MEIVKLALRNLARQKRRTFLLGGAIAFGILIVTLINGFAGAFVENVSENFANLVAGHVFVEGVQKSSSGRDLEIVRDDALLMEAVSAAGIEAKYVTRRSGFEATLIHEGRTAQLAIQGVDFSTETFLPERLVFSSGSVKGMEDAQGVILSAPIAERLGVAAGDRLLVQLRTYTGQQNVGEFAVAGITYDAGILGNMSGYANKAYVNELLGLGPEEYQTLGLYLPSLALVDDAGKTLYDEVKARAQVFDKSAEGEERNPVRAMMRRAEKETWEGVKYRVYTLNDILAQVRQIVDVLDTSSLVILVVLFVIIMVGITNTFRIIMFERIREIGTMRSIGMQMGEVRNLFLFEALFLAVGGALAGILLALLAMAGLSLIDFGMDSPLFIILRNGHLGFKLEAVRTIANFLIVSLLTLAAAYFPARNAAKLDPAVALRTTK